MTDERGSDPSADRPGGAAAGISARELVEVILEDRRTHRGKWGSGGFQALAVQRLGAWAHSLDGPVRPVAVNVFRVLHRVIENVYGTGLSHRTSIGRRVFITNHVGVQIDHDAVIGDGVKIRQGVTIGQGDSRTTKAAPRIEPDVSIGAGAVIAGGIVVGEGATIGPNAVVITDVPAGATVFAPPARVMKAKSGPDRP